MSTPYPLLLLQRLFAGTAAALGLIGALPARAQDIATSSGPFALQLVEKRSSLQFNANYGFVRVRYYEIRMLHRGKRVRLPDATGRLETDFRDVFLLSEAPEPALLVGNDGWQLITEREGKLVVSALTRGPADELRWAEGPPSERRIEVGRTRTEAPASLELKGRRRLLLDEQTVLDLGTLQTAHPGRRVGERAIAGEPTRAQTKAAATPADVVPAGYVLAIRDPLGTSPDGRAIAQLYRGPSNSPRDSLIVVASLDGSGQSQLIPLDLRALTGLAHFPGTVEPLQRHIEWLPAKGTELPQLRVLPAADKSRQGWRSQFQFGVAAPLSPQGQHLPRYSVGPVRPAMFAAVREHLIANCQATPQPAQPGDGPADRFERFNLWIMPLVLRFDAGERSLVVESAPSNDLLWAQTAVACVGDAIEAQLADGGPWRQFLALQR